MDEIQGVEKATRKTYSYMLTELQRLRNKEVRHLRRPHDFMSQGLDKQNTASTTP